MLHFTGPGTHAMCKVIIREDTGNVAEVCPQKKKKVSPVFGGFRGVDSLGD